MPRRATRIYNDQQRATLARAARAAEDPAEMTAAANKSRMSRYRAQVLRENPSLTGEQLERAAQLRLRADMIRVRAGQRATIDAA